MKNFTHRWPQSGHSFHILGHVFPIFKKVQGRLPLFVPLVTFLANVFWFNDRLPFDLVSRVVYKYMCGRCNSSYYCDTDKHLKVWSGEYIGISLSAFRKLKPSKESAICDHLLNCNKPHPLMSLSSWHMDIISIFFKSKRPGLLNMIDLP